MARVKVEKSKANPESKEVLAEAVIRIGEALQELKKSGLNEKAIVVLLHHKTGVSQRDIKTIFEGLRQMESWYCK